MVSRGRKYRDGKVGGVAGGGRRRGREGEEGGTGPWLTMLAS